MQSRAVWSTATALTVLRCLLLVGWALVMQPSARGGTPPPLHQQWQPQSENDPRLQQPVEIEIVGRSLRRGLPLLSEKTGVTLGVMPQDLDILGERKFTVIAKGLSLKAIIVQLCEALQECHWDIDASGDEPVYLLHRDAGTTYTREWAEGVEARREDERRRAAREERVEAARRALRMSNAELDELEKEDLFLARAARHPEFRKNMEGLVSLSDGQLEEFLDTGQAQLAYPDCPPATQEAALLVGAALNQEDFGHFGGTGITLEKRRQAAKHPERWRIWYWEADDGAVLFTIGVPVGGSYGPIQTFALPPLRTREFDGPRGRLYRLLVETGTTEEEADGVLRAQMQERQEEAVADEESRRQREWHEPSDPWLKQMVSFPDDKPLYWPDVLQLVAATGASVVSDHFSRQWRQLPPEAKEEVPLWRALYLICDQRGYRWQGSGHCLTFSAEGWWSLAPREVPETIVEDYAGRLERQGKLTLDDFVELAERLPDLASPRYNFPPELRISLRQGSRWALGFYKSLSPEQRARACSPDGLHFADMMPMQQCLVQARVSSLEPPVPADAPGEAVFQVEKRTTHNPGWDRHWFSFNLKLGDRLDGSGLLYAVPVPDADD